MGTLYNTNRVLASATMLNDFTYRNHLAPRLNQMALVMLESTYSKLIKNGEFLAPDDKNVWKLPVTRTKLSECASHKIKVVQF